jgi:hypothetical protein
MRSRSGTIIGALVLSATLAACGSSSSSSSQTSTVANGPNSARQAEITACLKKQGITPPPGVRQNRPARPPGAGAAGGGPPGGGLFGGGGPAAAQGGANGGRFRAALQKCGIRLSGRRSGSIASTPAGRAAIKRFAACMKKNGYKLPAPNLSGIGPVFQASKVNRSDPKFVAAGTKCQGLIPRPAGPGGAPPPGGSGA